MCGEIVPWQVEAPVWTVCLTEGEWLQDGAVLGQFEAQRLPEVQAPACDVVLSPGATESGDGAFDYDSSEALYSSRSRSDASGSANSSTLLGDDTDAPLTGVWHVSGLESGESLEEYIVLTQEPTSVVSVDPELGKKAQGMSETTVNDTIACDTTTSAADKDPIVARILGRHLEGFGEAFSIANGTLSVRAISAISSLSTAVTRDSKIGCTLLNASHLYPQASGKLTFLQCFDDGSTTLWEARLQLEPHTSNDAGGTSLVDGVWSGDGVNGTFTAKKQRKARNRSRFHSWLNDSKGAAHKTDHPALIL